MGRFIGRQRELDELNLGLVEQELTALLWERMGEQFRCGVREHSSVGKPTLSRPGE